MEENFSDSLELFGVETEEDDGLRLKLGVVPKVCEPAETGVTASDGSVCRRVS
jgi:hypothetical protein